MRWQGHPNHAEHRRSTPRVVRTRGISAPVGNRATGSASRSSTAPRKRSSVSREGRGSTRSACLHHACTRVEGQPAESILAAGPTLPGITPAAELLEPRWIGTDVLGHPLEIVAQSIERRRSPLISSKCLRFRVTTPRPCSSAVAAISASGSRVPNSRPILPARSAMARSTTTSRNGASSCEHRSVAELPANSSARVTTE